MVKSLLVVECQSSVNWFTIFENVVIRYPDGTTEQVTVDQAEWTDIAVTSYDTGLFVSLRAAKRPLPNSPQSRDRNIPVDFVLLRSISHGIVGQDSRNTLFGFMHADVPAVNSLSSAYMCLEKPIVYGCLKEIQKRLGKQNFPLIPQSYYPSFRTMILSPDLPTVVKVAHTHAGYGKMKITSTEQWNDLRSVIALHDDYATSEPFIEWDYDSRIQKIGSHYRLFKRISSNWKGNTGNSAVLEEVEMTDWHRRLADECAKAFGGLDILGLDLVHDEKANKEWILELNDTAIGLVHAVEQEDMTFMRDLVIEKMERIFGEQSERQKLKTKGLDLEQEQKEPLPAEPAEEIIERLQKEIRLLNVQKERETEELKKKIQELEKKKEEGSKKSWFS